MKFSIPQGYSPYLNLIQTEVAIKEIKDYFQKALARNLNLTRISAPLFVESQSGLNDTLNGIERAVSFDIKDDDRNFEIVQSLAKWKRFALAKYDFKCGEGIYTDMNAIRRDEDLDNIHSIFVDQWDWEMIIKKEERNLNTLKSIVRKIYNALKDLENYINSKYNSLDKILPEDIFFISTQELEEMYPSLSPKEREYQIAKEKGAIFIMQIGLPLKNGKPHDGRAPDYDDWTLNGDIIAYYPVLDIAFELSSMGIRVDETALKRQLKQAGQISKENLPFQRSLLNGELPYTIGGGIGQSRLCMFFLKKVHIGEVQASIWPQDMIESLGNKGVCLL